MTKNQSFWTWHILIAVPIIPFMLWLKGAIPLAHDLIVLAAQIYILLFFIKHHYREWK